MGEIKLNGINIKNRSVEYEFEISEDLKNFFSGREFIIEYNENIEKVPKAILSVPFVGNVLPIVWLTGSTLFIEELDREFYYAIPKIKCGYVKMYPESKFDGEIVVNRVVKCERDAIPGKTALLYSGGVDSTYTMCTHIKEHPDLGK